MTCPYDETLPILNGESTASHHLAISTSDKSVEKYDASFNELDMSALELAFAGG